MKYRDLFDFEPIETIIQLRDADKKESARKLVETYKISDRMGFQISNIVIPQIQFSKPVDNKGLLIVGNYGTGKSHLMSVISAIAEFSDLVEEIDNQDVKKHLNEIAGKFKVIRVEIGAVTASLRNILIREIEDAFKNWGLEYKFPTDDTISSNKDALIESVSIFQKKYPNMGVLLIVDELLDYLKTRNEQEIILDLGFLREMGEVSKSTPFRFIGGLQEALFDSVRFSFVSDQLRRVRDRFEQIRIVREDIAFVVSSRLLKKNHEQIARITEHLRKFTPLYKNLSEHINEYARLFPIHPSYIDVFEDVYIAEKREVLKTFSKAMRSLLDKEVPKDEPGLISYDQYWDEIKGDPSIRSIPEVSEVIDKSDVLFGRVKNAFSKQHLLPLALRIINGLSVIRLTTDDINAPLGVRPEELCDGLCLFIKTPENSNEFLLNQVQVALKEIRITVSGQYISHNDTNDQYYIDVKKDIDFDAEIEERGEFMGPDGLNRSFFDALRQELDLSETTYVTGHKIWFFEINWPEKKITRPGYLFFGKPDERSTAQPPRDFYVYFAPPFSKFEWNGDTQSNDVIFHLKSLGNDFEEYVRLYAGSSTLANESPSHREIYSDKADVYLRKFLRYLHENIAKNLVVHHQGVTKSVNEVLRETNSTASNSIRELIEIVSSQLLSPEFLDKYPNYPAFLNAQQPISEEARPNSAKEAISYIAGRGITRLGRTILEGLELIDGEDRIRPNKSEYAKYLLGILQKKQEGQVVNRGEIMEVVATGLIPVEKDLRFRLEPEWVVVILLSLVHTGEIILNLDGKNSIDASNIEKAAILPISDLQDFRFISRPKELPINLWTSIFEGFELTPGLIKDVNTREDAVKTLQGKVNAEINHLVELEHQVDSGLNLWNTPIFTDKYSYIVEKGVVIGSDLPNIRLSVTDLKPFIRGYKNILDELVKYNTVGKLRNFRMTKQEIDEAISDRESIRRIDILVKIVNDVQPITTYLVGAQSSLPEDHAWSEKANIIRQKLVNTIREFGNGTKKTISTQSILKELDDLKKEYIKLYSDFHRELILSAKDDDLRQKIYLDDRLKALDNLQKLELTNNSELLNWKNWIAELVPCREFHEGVIENNPICPFCNLHPKSHKHVGNAKERLIALDQMLDDILMGWRKALNNALSSESAQKSIQAMGVEERKPIDKFMRQKEDSVSIPSGFVVAAENALKGIRSLTLSTENLINALKTGGLPSTVNEIERRFSEFLRQHLKGYDPENTRLSFDK